MKVEGWNPWPGLIWTRSAFTPEVNLQVRVDSLALRVDPSRWLAVAQDALQTCEILLADLFVEQGPDELLELCQVVCLRLRLQGVQIAFQI